MKNIIQQKGAAINGFKQFADKAEFLLDKNEKLNFKTLKRIKSNEKIIFLVLQIWFGKN